MQFEKNLQYHIYNQGNNRQKVFFEPRNYLYFITKMREFILPHADILCYCLMPNHFHILVNVHNVHLSAHNSSDDFKSSDEFTKSRSFNQSIAILLRSYTRAINIQENRTGSLFRPKTKAKNGIIEELITINNKHKDIFFGGDNYLMTTCFKYIHNNPVKAGLVLKPEDWQYSSAPDYAGVRKGTLCNKQLAKTLGFI